MLDSIVHYRMDAILFDALLLVAVVAGHSWLRIHYNHGVPIEGWIAVGILLSAGIIAPEWCGNQQRDQLRGMLQGIAPTYAQELELGEHWKIDLQTAPTDPHYLALIDEEIRWQKANPSVSDIYTMRKRPDGKYVFIVDSETDYNHNGRIDPDDSREQRTDIGEEYTELTPLMVRAFDGVAGFDDLPVSDRWGTWVSAYVPLYRPDGTLDGIVGVDYDARRWNAAIMRERLGALGGVGVLSLILFASTIVITISRVALQRHQEAERVREKLQAQLVVASRQAGMAVIATNVLHNVGNVLNGVNVSAGVLTENLQNSKVSSLQKAAGIIQEHRADLAGFLTTDDRGRRLPEYLTKLSDVLLSEQQATLHELSILAQSVDHIKQIVASQQSFARDIDQRETLDIAQTVDDAVRMNALSLERHGIRIERDFQPVPPITADRHKLLQILVNLISNAKKAVADNAGDKQIRLRIETVDLANIAHARITVIDNGVGIAAADLARIFNYGFTTRKDGHGFGLHSSAIAAQQMEGALCAHSQGPGQGARFTIDIPIALYRKTAHAS